MTPTGSGRSRPSTRPEYDTQYSAASLYEGGWRASDLPDLIEQYNLTSEEADRIYDELLQIEQSAQSKED